MQAEPRRDNLRDEDTQHVTLLFCDIDAGAGSVLWEECYSCCTFPPVADVPAGRKLTPNFIHVPWSTQHPGLLLPTRPIWMPDLPRPPWMRAREAVTLKKTARRRMFLTFVSGVVPFQHGSASTEHQFHMSPIQKQTQPRALRLSANWISGKRAPRTPLSGANNICWAAYPTSLPIRQVYGHTIYGRYRQPNQHSSKTSAVPSNPRPPGRPAAGRHAPEPGPLCPLA